MNDIKAATEQLRHNVLPTNASLGIMQGRLTDSQKNRLQFFPVDVWPQEFEIAHSMGFDHIEWIIDQKVLTSKEGIPSANWVFDVISKTGVSVHSVCGDFLLDAAFLYHNKEQEFYNTFTQICEFMTRIGAESLVVPCVEHNSFLRNPNKGESIKRIQEMCDILNSHSLTFLLESDLPPTGFLDLVGEIDRECLYVNWDSGNNAALGYDPNEEWQSYGHLIKLVHLKDRDKEGKSVPFGSGLVDWTQIARLLKFSGVSLITVQSWRDTDARKSLLSNLLGLQSSTA